MDFTVYIVIGIVVVAALLFFVLRKPAQLQPGEHRPELEAKKRRLRARKLNPGSAGRRPRPQARAIPCRARGRGRSPPLDGGSPDRRARREAAGLRPVGPPVPPPKADVLGMRKGLAATRGGFIARLTALFAGKKEIDPAILEQIEEVMLTSDVGVKTTQAILERLREALDKNELRDTDAVWAALRAEATRILGDRRRGAPRRGASRRSC